VFNSSEDKVNGGSLIVDILLGLIEVSADGGR
jgi:hypothetical protein